MEWESILLQKVQQAVNHAKKEHGQTLFKEHHHLSVDYVQKVHIHQILLQLAVLLAQHVYLDNSVTLLVHHHAQSADKEPINRCLEAHLAFAVERAGGRKIRDMCSVKFAYFQMIWDAKETTMETVVWV